MSNENLPTIDFEDLQQAFVDKVITFEQFVHVLITNFGSQRARSLVKKSIKEILSVQEYRELKRTIDVVIKTCCRI